MIINITIIIIIISIIIIITIIMQGFYIALYHLQVHCALQLSKLYVAE